MSRIADIFEAYREHQRGIAPLRAAGLGPGPYSCWTSIRLPLAELARRDPDVAQRRRARIASESAILHVEASRCGGCQAAADDLYVVTDGEGRRNAALCRDCVRDTGDGVLLRKVAYLDREYERRMGRVTRKTTAIGEDR
jgi:hypothetical protein